MAVIAVIAVIAAIAGAIAGRRQANAGGHHGAAAVDGQRRLHGLLNALGQGGQCSRCRHELTDDGEFIGAEARHQFAGARQLQQPARHGTQQRVAAILAVQVVDGLKTIQVNQHQRHLGAGTRGALHSRAQSLAKGGAVGQSG